MDIARAVEVRTRPVHFPREGGLLLWLLGSIFGTPVVPTIHSAGIEGSSNDVITAPRQIFYTPAPDEHDGVLLEVMTLTRNVGGDFDIVCEPHSSNLAERRVRLLGGRGVDPGTYTAFLRASLQRGSGPLLDHPLSPFANELIDGRQTVSFRAFSLNGAVFSLCP